MVAKVHKFYLDPSSKKDTKATHALSNEIETLRETGTAEKFAVFGQLIYDGKDRPMRFKGRVYTEKAAQHIQRAVLEAGRMEKHNG